MASPALPAPPITRNRTLLVGSALSGAASVMLFAGLFAVYISIRQDNEHRIEEAARAGGVIDLGGTVWFPELAVQIAPGTMMLFTCLGSIFTMAWAVQAIRNDDRRNCYVALGLTMLFGAAVINQVAFAVADFGIPVDRSTPALLLYVLYGTFIVFLGAAIGFLLLMGIRAIAGQFDSHNADGIEAAAIYWYSIMMVYPVIWYLITITK